MGMIESYIKIVGNSYDEHLASVGVWMLILFCLGSVIFMAFMGWQKGAKWSAGLLLVEYLFLLLALTILFRSVGPSRSFNFTPFWSYRVIRKGHEILLAQAIANVVAFIPIGLLLGISFPKLKWWQVLLIGVAFSLLIETLQFFLRRGFAEFDDLFHNVLGCMIGYGVYGGMAWMVKIVRKSRVVDAS